MDPSSQPRVFKGEENESTQCMWLLLYVHGNDKHREEGSSWHVLEGGWSLRVPPMICHTSRHKPQTGFESKKHNMYCGWVGMHVHVHIGKCVVYGDTILFLLAGSRMRTRSKFLCLLTSFSHTP